MDEQQRELLELAQACADRAKREVELRITERQFMRDIGRHPEMPVVALIGQFDQWAAEQRADAGVYDWLVQHLADGAMRGLEGRGVLAGAVATRCGVCLVSGLTEHL